MRSSILKVDSVPIHLALNNFMFDKRKRKRTTGCTIQRVNIKCHLQQWIGIVNIALLKRWFHLEWHLNVSNANNEQNKRDSACTHNRWLLFWVSLHLIIESGKFVTNRLVTQRTLFFALQFHINRWSDIKHSSLSRHVVMIRTLCDNVGNYNSIIDSQRSNAS